MSKLNELLQQAGNIGRNEDGSITRLYRIFNFLFCTLDVHIFLLRYNFYSP